MIKKTIALICVLALVVSMCSVFSFAAEPETEKEEPTRVIVAYKVGSYSTYMYNSNSTSSGYKYNFSFPIGTRMTRIDTQTDYGSFYKMTCNYNGSTYTGFVLISHLAVA